METSLLRCADIYLIPLLYEDFSANGWLPLGSKFYRTLQPLRHHARTVWSDQEGDGTLPFWASHPIWNSERWRAEGVLEDDVQYVWKEHDPFRV